MFFCKEEINKPVTFHAKKIFHIQSRSRYGGHDLAFFVATDSESSVGLSCKSQYGFG